jgi:hypothetical protein
MGHSRHLNSARLLAAVFLCGAIGANAQQTPAPPASQSVIVKGIKDPSSWFRAESQHFVVFSDTSRDDVTQLLNNLEKLDHLLRIYTRKYNTGASAAQKMTLYYHGRIEGFTDAAPDHPNEAVGLYSSCGAGVQGFAVNLQPIESTSNEQLARAPLNESLSYIFEAYARHFLYRYTNIRSPAFFIDGFAQYFSSVRFSDNQMVVGKAATAAARYLYFIDQGHRHKLDFQDILTPDESTDEARVEYLARSWLITHYMLATEDHRARLDKYLELVNNEVPAGKAFEDAFGVPLGELDTLMWRYRLKGLEVRRIDMPTLPAAQLSFTGFPASATDVILADATLKSCPGRKTGESVLRTLLGHQPHDDFGRMTLSRAQIEWGNPQDALPYLTEASRKNAKNFEAAYLLGLANLRLSEQHRDASYLQEARRQLAHARSLDPASAEAAYAAFKVELGSTDKPDVSALGGAISAWLNAHEVDTYARSAALAFAYLGKGAEADTALTLLAHNARDPEMATWAKTWQSRLSTGVARKDLLAEMRRDPSSAGLKEWTVASEDLARMEEDKAGLEQARGFLEAQQLSNPMENALSGNTPVSIPLKE